MDAESFYRSVQEHDGIEDESTAEEATRAVLGALGARISAGEAEKLAEFLPGETAEFLLDGADESPDDFGQSEFLVRVSETGSVSESDAESYATAVAGPLTETVPHEELHDVTSQLPTGIRRFFDETR